MRNLSLIAGLSVLSCPGSAQPSQQLAEQLNQPISVERSSDVGQTPLERHMGKLAVAAKVNEESHRFIFDSGSPTMISKQLADELELRTIGSNVGRDANGKVVQTDFAIVDTLELAGTTFRHVPVMIFDFDAIDPHRCFFDGGVIGSEIFPGSAWRISTESLTLEVAKTSAALTAEKGSSNSMSIPLTDFGYPHAPIFDYSIGDVKDKGLFDTGNSATLVLFNRVADDPSVLAKMQSDSIVKGRGSEGMSAGGLGGISNLLRFEVESVSLGSNELGPLPGIVRQAPPTLMGLGILAQFNVTLDYPNSQMLLNKRQVEVEAEPYPGFGLMVVEGEVRVMQIFAGSRAESAGLVLGDRVTAIDDKNLPDAEQPCALQQWLIEAKPAARARAITVMRNGEAIRLPLREH